MQNPRTTHRSLPVVAALTIFVVYLLTMPHGLTADLGGADGGELATAVYTRGLVHPPGYPTYLLLAQSVWLIPLGSFAYRLNIFSALCAAGAVGLLAHTIAHWLQGDEHGSDAGAWWAGVIASLGLGGTLLVWTQAVIVEVYVLALLWCVGLLALTLWIERTNSPVAFSRRLALLAVAAGLGLGSHFMTGMMAGACLLYLLLRHPKRFLTPGTLLIIPGFLLGVMIFVYLPLRAGAVPVSNWGNPQTVDSFLYVVRGEVYADRIDWRAGLAIARLASLVRVLVEQIGVGGLIFAGLGASLLWDTDRPLAVVGAVLICVDLVLTSSYFSADILPYLYPALIICWLMAGLGWQFAIQEWLKEQIKHPGWYRVLYGLAVLAIIIPLAYKGIRETRTTTTDIETFAETVVNDAPAGSVIFSNGNAEAFSVRYAVMVSAQRDDIVPVNEWTLWHDWYRADLAKVLSARDVVEVDDLAGRTALDVIAQLPEDTPVIFSYNPNLPAGYSVQAMENGVSYRLVERPAQENEH